MTLLFLGLALIGLAAGFRLFLENSCRIQVWTTGQATRRWEAPGPGHLAVASLMALEGEGEVTLDHLDSIQVQMMAVTEGTG